MATPISHSEHLDYRIQHQISKYAEEMIEHTQSCRSLAFLDLGVSPLTSLVLQVFAVGELTIRGLGLIFSSDPQLGKSMLKRVPKKAFEIPLGFLGSIIKGPFDLFVHPKFCILWGVETTKVDLEHAERGTIDSEDHQYDLQLAFGRATIRINEWRNPADLARQIRGNPTLISHSERLDYRIQHQIFNYINEITEQGQRLRPSAFFALGVSNATFFILRVFAVGELTIRGLRFIYSSDYKLGKVMLKRVSIQAWQATVGLAASTVLNSCRIIKEPKDYILNNLEQTQIDIQHAEADTFDSKNYQSDLQAARGRATEKLREWQSNLLHHEL